MTFFQMKRIVREGQEIPKWYGDAYFDYPMQAWICYPIPLNWIIKRGYNWWWRIKKPNLNLNGEVINKSVEIYREGWNAGYDAGYKAGYNQAVEISLKIIDNIKKDNELISKDS